MPEPAEKPLQSWKEIAAYLERDIRTARRWEKEAGLPIRRHTGGKRSSVYAYPSEIDAWRTGKPASQAAESPSRPAWLWAAAAAVLLAASVSFWLQRSGLDPVARAGAVDGSGVRTIEVCTNCDWIGGVSPDGRYLSESDWVNSGDIGVKDLETGEYTSLGDKPSWDGPLGEAHMSLFSPDGRKIAYAWLLDRDGEAGYELRIIDAFAGDHKPVPVYYNPELRFIEPDAWTEDGRLLVLFQRRDWSIGLGFVSIDSGELTVIRSLSGAVNKGVSRAKLSPDAQWVAYDVATDEDQSNRNVFLLAADGSEEKAVVDHRANDVVLGFTPDSKTLLFASDRTGSFGLWGVAISDLGETGEPRMLLRDIGSINPLGVSREGALFYSRAMGSEDLYEAEIDLATGKTIREPRVLETTYQGSNEGPWLSPKADRFAYFASPAVSRGALGSLQQLRVRDRASGEEIRVPTGGLELRGYYGMAWAPDGNRILFPAQDEVGRWAFYQADLTTLEVAKLVGQDEVPAPRPIGWTADGRALLYGWESPQFKDGKREKTILRLSPDDREPQRIYTSAGPRIVALSLSQQHDRIAWRELGEPERIKVISVEGGEAQTVYEHFADKKRSSVSSVVWTPDGNALLVVLKEAGDPPATRIRLVPLDGGPLREIDLAMDGLRRLEIHPDGKTVFFKAGRADRRLFKTENYLPKGDGANE